LPELEVLAVGIQVSGRRNTKDQKIGDVRYWMFEETRGLSVLLTSHI
jgi:hypothetical protein